MPSRDRCLDAALALSESAARAGFRGPDPFDGLWWRWPRALVGGRRRRQAIVQLHARSPVDLRRLYRRRHRVIRQGARGLRLGRGARAAADRAPPRRASSACARCELLDADRSAGPRRRGATRGTCRRGGASIRPAPRTSSSPRSRRAGCSRAPPRPGRGDLADRARAAARWVLDELWIEPEGYFAYHRGPARQHPQRQPARRVAGRMSRGRDGSARPRAGACGRCERTLDAQRPDGSWPYGEGRNLAWADSFHSGYVLMCLDRLRAVDGRVGEAVQRGAAHYRGFFDAAGRARLWADKPFPEDAHSAGTGLSALSVAGAPRAGRARAARARGAAGPRSWPARRARRAPPLPLGRTTVRYLRWCDAHVALGLVDAAAALRGVEDCAAPERS